jgi:hypothetical protein
MGYMFVLGSCYTCKQLFTFNASLVPSLKDQFGERQPICRTCMDRANAKRKEMGLEPHPIHPDAYEAEEVA